MAGEEIDWIIHPLNKLIQKSRHITNSETYSIEESTFIIMYKYPKKVVH